MTLLLIAALGAAFTAWLIVCHPGWHQRFSLDHDLAGVQKFHTRPTPRIGGIALLGGLLLALAGWLLTGGEGLLAYLWLLASALPVFAAGLVEDVTRRVSPLQRLVVAFLSAAIAIWLFDARLTSLSLPYLDDLLQYSLLAASVMTIFAVGGVCHSINIIDGYNGLMPGVALMASLAFAWLGWQLGDVWFWQLSLLLAGCMAGFLYWNFPGGRLFAGDAGAYLIGFLLAQLSVLLVVRHPQVSPWLPCLLLLYPITETVFSMYRKKLLRQMSPGQPDGLHLHMLVYKRLVRPRDGDRLRRNSATSPYLWLLNLLPTVLAMLCWQSDSLLKLAAAGFVLFYLACYRALVKFRMPRWLVWRG